MHHKAHAKKKQGRQHLALDALLPAGQRTARMSASENQFSLPRAALKTGGASKNNFPSVGLFSVTSPWGLHNRPRRAALPNQTSITPRCKRTRRYDSFEILRHLWVAFPAEHETLRVYGNRAKSYRNDCGCAMGGVFVVITLAVLILYGFVYHLFDLRHLLHDAVSAVACLFSAAILGKLVGIGIARTRLVLLGRELLRRYSSWGN